MKYFVFNQSGNLVDTFDDYEFAHAFCEHYRRSIGTCYLDCPDSYIEYPAIQE